MVIRPIVTYAALVWWTKTNKSTTWGKLQKLQRLACLGITGAMNSAPTEALQTLINLSPLHICVKREGLRACLRLTQTKNFKPGDLTGHMKILEEIRPEEH